MKKTNKALAVILSVIMVLTLIPMTAFAAYYTIELDERITVTVPEEGFSYCGFTPDEDGTYVVYSDSGENYVDPFVDISDEYGNEIASDDDNDYANTYDFYCIFDAEAGVDYTFKMGEYDDLEAEFDIIVKVFGEITHQPTSDEPYVEVTEGSYAEYQWYRIVDSFEVTDEIADAREGKTAGEFATYDSENGWTGVEYDEYSDYIEYNYFKLDLEAGQTIKMTPDCDVREIGIWCECDSAYEYWNYVDEGETIEFIADHDCYYCTYVDAYNDSLEVPGLKAEIIDVDKANNEAQLEADEAGTYVCLVTFDGCRYEVSDEVEIGESNVDTTNKILEADINVRTDIAGLNVYDYEDYIEILTEGLQFEDDYGDPAVYVEDSDGEYFEGEFVSGETYTIYVYLSAESGYKLANTVDGTVNGEEVLTEVDGWVPGGIYGDVSVKYVEFEFEITVTDPCNHVCHRDGFMGFLWSIVNFFNRIFGLNPFCVCGAAHY